MQHQIKKFHNSLAALVPLCGCLAILALLCAYPVIEHWCGSNAFAEGAAQDGALELSLSADSLALSSTNSDANGFVSSSVVASVTSSASAGYNLYMSAAGKDADDAYTASLVNANGKQYTIGTLPSSGDGSSIDLNFTTADDTHTYVDTSNFTNNKWAYSVADVTSGVPTTGTSTFKAIPLDETVINTNSDVSSDTSSGGETSADTAISTLNTETMGGISSTRPSNIYAKKSASGAANDGSAPDDIEVTLAARTDNTVPAGEYTNTLVFTAIGIDYTGTITYNANGGNGDMTMVAHTNLSAGDSVTLYAPNYWRSGYGFAGWSEDTDAATKLANGESVTVYGPQETITAPSSVSSGIVLYAVWIASAGNLQGWDGCSTMDIGDVTALTDTRDGNTYAVAKLKDGKCWVVENFRLHSGNITAANTNNPINNFTWPASSRSWCASDNTSCINKATYNDNNLSTSLTPSPTANDRSNSTSWYSHGIYYTWYTATAGNGIYSIASGNLSGDMCPLGWHLPTSTNSGEFQRLYTAINAGTAGVRKYPNNFIYSGMYSGWSGSGVLGLGRYGNNWSSTARSNIEAYGFYLRGSGGSVVVYPSGYYRKRDGMTMRCITDTPYTIVYNQNGEAGDGESAGTDGTTTVGGDMSMVSHADVATGSSINLYAPNYWRKGYGFLGWSFDPKAGTDGNTSTIYGPNERITAPNSYGKSTMTLYAVWKASEGNMQSWTGCSSMGIGDVTALTDTRDGNTYAVAKLADNKCWQTENMRLSSGTVDTTNTNNPISNFAWTASSNTQCTDRNSACFDKVVINTNNINSSLIASPTTNNNSSSWYGYGVTYNWYTATAGNGKNGTSSGNVSGDICPLGWHLPTGTSSGEFQMMYNSTNGSTSASIRKFPYNFAWSGFWSGSSAGDRGTNGGYWSSTANSGNTAYRLDYGSSYINPSINLNKYYGLSVRCIANTPTEPSP